MKHRVGLSRTEGEGHEAQREAGARGPPLLTVLRQLHRVAQDRAVPVEGAHPGQQHGVAVRGVQAGQQVLRRVRQLTGRRGSEARTQVRRGSPARARRPVCNAERENVPCAQHKQHASHLGNPPAHSRARSPSPTRPGPWCACRAVTAAWTGREAPFPHGASLNKWPRTGFTTRGCSREAVSGPQERPGNGT